MDLNKHPALNKMVVNPGQKGKLLIFFNSKLQ